MNDLPTPNAIQLIKAMVQPTLLLDPQRIVAAANQAFVDAWAAYDATIEDLVGCCLDDLEGPLDGSLVDRLRQLPQGREGVQWGAAIWKPESEDKLRADISLRLVRTDPGAAPWEILTVEPTSESSQLRKEGQRVSRLAVLGSLSAGMAHDLNNQLAAGLNITHLLRDDLGGDPRHERALAIMESSAQQAAAISRRLLSVAGRGEPAVEDVELDEFIPKSLMLIKHEVPPTERFDLVVKEQLGALAADAAQFQYMVVLMALSACTALRENGSGTFRAGKTSIGLSEQIELEVICDRPADLGETWPEIARIAKDHGGEAQDLSSEEGLEIRVRIPIASARQHLEDRLAPEAPARKGRHIVLVIDDDPMVRDVAEAMVQRLEYDAVSADGGQRAIQLIDDGLRPDLILLDLVMGALDGSTTLKQIRDRLPDARVLLSSGYGTSIDARNVDGMRTDGLLEKPYSLAILKKAIDQILRADEVEAR